MPFARPTLSALVERIGADIEARIEGARASLARTTEGVLARVMAAAVHGLHGHLDYLSKQVLPDTAEEDWLVRIGGIWGVTRTPAAKASGEVGGTGTAATVLPSGTELQNAEGVLYVTTSPATVTGGGLLSNVPVQASDPGADGNVDVGEVLQLTEPVSGIDPEFTVEDDGASGGLTGGLDIEDIEAYRTRVLDRIGDPPSGGGAGDYVAWAKEVTGVTRAWEQAEALGPGTVRVVFVRDNDTGSIVPDSAEVSEVQDYLQETDGSGNIVGGVAPIFAGVTVVAPTTSNLDITCSIKKEAGYTDATVQANVEAAIDDMLLEHAEPGGAIRSSQIREAISRAEGEDYHTLTSPAGDQTYTDTEIPVRGTVTITWL